MRTGAAATILVSGLLALSSCGGPQPTTPDTKLEGNVYASPSAGGSPVGGARVTASLGSATQSVITGPDGHFSLTMNGAQTVQAFNITVEPPDSSNLVASSYFKVPLEAYRSQYGAASELNIYLNTTAPSAPLPGAPAKRGCITGLLKDVGGQPVASNALEVVDTPAGTSVPRPLYPDCNTEFATIPNFSAGHALLPQAGETGLVIYGGSRVVRTNAQGRYLMPVQTSQNLSGVSGSMWAGNYDGSDTGSLATANALYWSKFQYVPEVKALLNAVTPVGNTATDTRDITLENFDPATNSRVMNQSIRYDGSAVSRQVDGATAGILVDTTASFEHAITSAALPLGEYFDEDALGTQDLRVMKLASGTNAQSIAVTSRLIRYDTKDFFIVGDSTFYGWRNGVNQGQPLNATYLAIPAPQAPAQAATGVSRAPSMSWSAVPGGKVYQVALLRLEEDDSATLAWVGYTPDTSLQVPLTLDANATYIWQVYTDDGTEMADYIGRDPLALEAARWKPTSALVKARTGESALNRWRGQAAQVIVQRTGSLPRPDAAYQNLQTTGYRDTNSQESIFTTGN
ncbi:hypothetical protein [Deinococcus yunweiensis]|uniref:hypothetical protein n=1 Tax=Deinococcus yunweiensis TaxID=367282 RepID=UPI00398F2EB8